MRRLINTPAFAAFSFASYAAFFVLTMLVFDHADEGVGAGSMVVGFPFRYYASNCFGSGYIWTGLLGNMIVGAAVGFGAGLGLTNLRLKMKSPEFRAKWY